MADTYFVRGKILSQGSMSRTSVSSQKMSLSRARPTTTRAPTKKNREARRVASSATGVGGVIEK